MTLPLIQPWVLVVFFGSSVAVVPTASETLCRAAQARIRGQEPEATTACVQRDPIRHGFRFAEEVSMGDVNGDGALTITDVVILQRFLAGVHEEPPTRWCGTVEPNDDELDDGG